MVREKLKMTEDTGSYFDPESSAESEKRVIVRPLSDLDDVQSTKILEAFDGMAQCTNRFKSDFFQELDQAAINHLLVVSKPPEHLQSSYGFPISVCSPPPTIKPDKTIVTVDPQTMKITHMERGVLMDSLAGDAADAGEMDGGDKIPRSLLKQCVKFKLASDKKAVSRSNGTQVVESDLMPECWDCQGVKIKQEGEDSVTVKKELGMSGNDAIHNKPLTQEKAMQARVNGVKEISTNNQAVLEAKCKMLEEKIALEAKCKQLEEKTNAWKARVVELEEELVEKMKKTESELTDVSRKYEELMKRHEELKNIKEKADMEMAEMRQKHVMEMKKVEEESNKRLLECRQELQVMVKEIKQEHEEKQQDLIKKLAVAQQEVSDSQNKWEDSEKKTQDLNQELQSLRQQLSGFKEH